MPESRGRRGQKRFRSKPRRPPRAFQPPPGEPPLVGDVRRALADPDPLHMLSLVSMLMYVTDPRRDSPFAGPDAPTSMPRDELVATFIDVVCPETSALLAVFAAMIGDDDVLRARIRRELNARPRLEPAWLSDLAAVRVNRAMVMSHVLGDGDNIMLGVDLPTGREFTCTVYVDHNVGTLVKDAFTISEPFATVLAHYQQINDDPDTTWEDIGFADARARIEEAINVAAITWPPFETQNWPACRALIEWLIRDLPAGEPNWSRQQWDEKALVDLSDEFFRSEVGSGLDDPDRRGLMESLLWFATDYSTGDPLRWSPVKVELLLADWLPRKVLAPAEYLALAPELLRVFIAFVHDKAGIRSDLTSQAIAAVDQWEPEFQRIIRSDRPQGVEAVLAALGLGDDTDRDLYLSVADIMLEHLESAVGSRAALDELDDHPLPDEPFRWEDVPPDIAERVREILELIDRCCAELLDTEYRTASRRLLTRFASSPELFRRKGKPQTTAAAIVWIVGKVNDLFHDGHLQVKELMSYFGLTGSVSQRAETLMRGAGFSYASYDLSLTSPQYLVSTRRRLIIELRDRYKAADF